MFTWPFSEMFDDCQFLMCYFKFIFRKFILTIIIFIIMKSVNPPPDGAKCSYKLASKIKLMHLV